jgi:hypothetical protein
MTILPDLCDELSAAARRLDEPSRRRMRWPRRSRRTLIAVPVAIAALSGIALAAAGTFSGKPFATSQYRYGHCPRHVIALGPNALTLARQAAVHQAHLAYPHRNLHGIRVTGAHIVRAHTPRSHDAAHCGLLDRTVLVELYLPNRYHSASLGEGAVYVSHVKPPGRAAYYQLWGLEH